MDAGGHYSGLLYLEVYCCDLTVISITPHNGRLWVWGSRIGPSYPPACHKRQLIVAAHGLQSMSVEERVLAVEPILCCGIEEAIHSFGLNFTKSEG